MSDMRGFHPQTMVRFALLARTSKAIAIALALPSCSLMSSTGPTSGAVNRLHGNELANADIRIIDVTNDVARRVIASKSSILFSQSLGDGHVAGSIVGLGDVLDIAIWEAPPATLFGTVGGDSRTTAASTTIARGASLPEQMVDIDGRITIPFVGPVRAAGRTPQAIANEVSSRLAGKAHDPQVIVRLVQNAATNVTIIGDVANSTRMPLTTKGERLLDALAMAGGVKQPVGKITIQITRQNRVAALPLETVIRDPRQNIRLQADDVITVLFQPYSFTALGATGANAEIPFEGTGLTLAQALGRIGGLQDQRADARGVFIFRLEDPAALGIAPGTSVNMTPEGKIPVVYRIDLKNPATLFAAQTFPIRNQDLLYVSNAPLADAQKFLGIISSTVFPLVTAAAIYSQ
jgi:polysaccharide biosynthesis/export protein